MQWRKSIEAAPIWIKQQSTHTSGLQRRVCGHRGRGVEGRWVQDPAGLCITIDTRKLENVRTLLWGLTRRSGTKEWIKRRRCWAPRCNVFTLKIHKFVWRRKLPQKKHVITKTKSNLQTEGFSCMKTVLASHQSGLPGAKETNSQLEKTKIKSKRWLFKSSLVMFNGHFNSIKLLKKKHDIKRASLIFLSSFAVLHRCACSVKVGEEVAVTQKCKMQD